MIRLTQQQIVASYGHSGPHGDGADAHVADLLQRTTEGQWKALQAYESAEAAEAVRGPAVLQVDLATMTMHYVQRLALTRWKLATVFLDGVIATYRDELSFPVDVYTVGDSLCDSARRLSRQAVEVATQQKTGSKVRLASIDSLENLKLSVRTLRGVWGVFQVIGSIANEELTFWEGKPLPTRFKALIERELRQMRPHVESLRYLSAEWRATRIDANRFELAEEAIAHVKDLYEQVQRLWAPYLMGNDYTAALRHKSMLNELSILDPWVFTDPMQRMFKKGNKDAEQELADLWEALREPDKAEQLAAQVQALLKSRHLRRRTGRGYGMVPWPSQYLVRRSFDLEGSQFAGGDLVAFYAKRDSEGKYHVSLRRTSHLTHILDLLGMR